MKKLLAKARALYKKKRYKEGLVIAEKVLKLDKKNDEALFYVAHGLYFAGQFKKALPFWHRLEKISPREPYLHLNMGVLRSFGN